VVPSLAAIAAVARNGVIGADGDLPWRLREDLRRFRRLTTGHDLIMGRRTWDSIGRPLPERRSWVLSRSNPDLPDEVELLGGIDDALEVARSLGDAESRRFFCIGGEEIYRQLLPHVADLFLTRVDAEVEGDARFPEIDESQWEVAATESLPSDARNQYPTLFQHLRRRR